MPPPDLPALNVAEAADMATWLDSDPLLDHGILQSSTQQLYTVAANPGFF